MFIGNAYRRRTENFDKGTNDYKEEIIRNDEDLVIKQKKKQKSTSSKKSVEGEYVDFKEVD